MRRGYGRYSNSYKPRSIRKYEGKAKRNFFLSIILVIFLVYVFLSWGLPALIGGLSFLNKFKPAPKQAEQLGSAIAPPVLNIPFESTNSATIKISGYSTPNAKVQIFVDDQLQNTTDVLDDGSFQTDGIRLSLGQNNIYGVSVQDTDKKSLPSKTITLTYSNEKPKLNVDSPADGAQIKSERNLTVSGSTESPNSVSVNGQSLIVKQDGSFSTQIQLQDGDNTITVVAANPVGNTTQIQRKVNFAP